MKWLYLRQRALQLLPTSLCRWSLSFIHSAIDINFLTSIKIPLPVLGSIWFLARIFIWHIRLNGNFWNDDCLLEKAGEAFGEVSHYCWRRNTDIFLWMITMAFIFVQVAVVFCSVNRHMLTMLWIFKQQKNEMKQAKLDNNEWRFTSRTEKRKHWVCFFRVARR